MATKKVKATAVALLQRWHAIFAELDARVKARKGRTDGDRKCQRGYATLFATEDKVFKAPVRSRADAHAKLEMVLLAFEGNSLEPNIRTTLQQVCKFLKKSAQHKSLKTT